MDTFGSLAECLTDADRESCGRARSSRGRSMALAVAIETATAGALLVWPLMHLGVLGQAPDLLPRPVFFAPTPARVIEEPVQPRSPQENPLLQTLNARPAISSRPAQQGNDADRPPDFGFPGDPGLTERFIDLGSREAGAPLPSPEQPLEKKAPRVSIGVMDAMLIGWV